MNNNLAPIVLFVYNRPWHTEQTLQALLHNKNADKSILYIYCDGPKPDADQKLLSNICQVRELVKSKQWCGEVIIFESDSNKGLANSIQEGVTNTVKKYGKVIVMEDDLLTSHAFLSYMNQALDYYEDRKSVFSISAYALPPSKLQIPDGYPYDVYVGLRNSSWGWGTWIDRWQQIDWEMNSFDEVKNIPSVKKAFARLGDDVFDMLSETKMGRLKIWSIQFTLAHFINHAVSIIPVKSYVDNIGMDGSGENCYANESIKNEILNHQSEIRFTDILYENDQLINAFYNAYCRKKRPVWKKAINRFSRIMGRRNVFVIKKKVYC